MILDFAYPAPGCNKLDNRPLVIKYVHYFYFAFILFIITAVVCIVLSLLTDPPTTEQVSA